MTTEIKPTAFKNGVPKAERNGMFGNETRLIEAAKAGERITAIVTYEVPKVTHDEIADEKYPTVAAVHIEPLFDEKRAEAAAKLQAAEYKARTGEGALDFGDMDDDDRGEGGDQ